MCTGTPPYIPAPNVITVEVVYDISGQKAENVYRVLSGAGTAVADMDRVNTKVQDWLRTNWKTITHSAVSVAVLKLSDAGDPSGVGREYIPSPAILGIQTGTLLPGNVTCAVKWGTGRTGKSFRGRTFIVGIGGGNIAGNALTAGALPVFIAQYTALITKLAAGGVVDKLAVVSKCQGGVWLSTAEVTPVISCSIDANLDSQRRRLNGRGI